MKRVVAIMVLATLPLVTPLLTADTVVLSPDSADHCPPAPAVVAAFLGFTEGQSEQFGVLLNQLHTELRSLQQQTTTLQQQLNILLSQADADPEVVGRLVLQIHALEQHRAQLVQDFQSDFAGLLMQEQKQKIDAVALASQLQPVAGAFVALHLVPPPPSPACQKQ